MTSTVYAIEVRPTRRSKWRLLWAYSKWISAKWDVKLYGKSRLYRHVRISKWKRVKTYSEARTIRHLV